MWNKEKHLELASTSFAVVGIICLIRFMSILLVYVIQSNNFIESFVQCIHNDGKDLIMAWVITSIVTYIGFVINFIVLNIKRS